MLNFLLFLLFLSPGIQYRIELRGGSVTLTEIVAICFVLIMLFKQLVVYKRVTLLNDPFVFLFLGLLLWVITIRPWSIDWKHGLSDIRDWFIPIVTYMVLTAAVRKGWRKWCSFLLICILFQSFIGIYQHFFDAARPFVVASSEYKTGFTISPETNQLSFVSFSVGLFSHPNGFAIYLLIGFMLLLGMDFGKRNVFVKIILVVPILLALFWTYAKTSLLVVIVAFMLFVLQRFVRNYRIFWVLVILILIFSVIFVFFALGYVPPIYLNTLYWRMGLWEIAFRIIGERIWLLLFGNGIDIFIENAYYSQPHNIYIFLLLEYGLIGVLWALLVIAALWRRGRIAYQYGAMCKEPLLASIWIAALSYFIIGLFETNLLSIEDRMIFMLLVACFTGLFREISSEYSISSKNSENG